MSSHCTPFLLQSTPIFRLPREILEEIAIQLVLIHPCSLPTHVLALTSTCKHLHHLLLFDHHLASRIYRTLFDASASTRRLGPRAHRPQNLASQLLANYRTLHEIRKGDVFSETIQEVFWHAFMMLLENDGRNWTQLKAAGLEDFIDRFVRLRLLEGSHENDGWPYDDVINSVALWIMSMTLTPERLRSQTPQQREELVALILPFVLVGCRYPNAFMPNNHFTFPFPATMDGEYPGSVETAHGDFPIYRMPRDVAHTINRFGCTFEVFYPLATTAAKHIYFTIRELIPFAIPPHLRANSNTSNASLTQFRFGADDIIEWTSHNGAKFYQSDQKDGTPSVKWDHAFETLISCGDAFTKPAETPLFKPGSVHGLWAGRLMLPSIEPYMGVVGNPHRPANFSEPLLGVQSQPLYMRLLEHHCINPKRPVNTGGTGQDCDDNLFNAWLPNEPVDHGNGCLTVTDKSGWVHQYETYVPGKPNSHDERTCTVCSKRLAEEDVTRRARMYEPEDVEMAPPGADYDADFAAVGFGSRMDDNYAQCGDCYEKTCNGIEDIVITGSTDSRHGRAWGFWRFYGRVRLWDGLIAILRVPVPNRSHLGKFIFTGYLTGGENIIGNWRFCSDDVDASMPSWEGPFTMSKKKE